MGNHLLRYWSTSMALAVPLFAAAPAGSAPGSAATFLELTTPQASGPRELTDRNMRHGSVSYDVGDGERWIVTNRYLPGDRHFFSMIYGASCGPDGTVFVAANGVVSAAETGRPPRSNRDWYADNGQGIWRVDPDGRVTPFSVRAYGTQPGSGRKTAVCDADVAEVTAAVPSDWGGIAGAPNGDVYVSHNRYHMVLKLRGDGRVDHVAGGGEKACVYEGWKDKKESGHRDGTGRQALFNGPRGLAFDRQGNLLVADMHNCALRRIDPSGNVTTMFKGCYSEPGAKDDRRKRINYEHVVLDPQGRPVVGGSFVVPHVDIYSNIHRLLPDGRVEQLLSARKGYANSGQLRVEYLSGLAYLPDGKLLLADDPNNLLRTLDGSRMADWLGSSGDRGEKDVNGPAREARLLRPGGLCAGGDGTVFVTPAGPRSSPLRKVDGKTRAVSTWLY